ncbi:MAG: hypothetical protein HY225_03275 [Candidatus Vogelbacteria bacterium]|nr:hypothetical protein [Candidatus Vogelbacteria bacterium]
MSMGNFFGPSIELAQALGNYCGLDSPARLDLTPTHMPIWGSPISISHVQESVNLRIWRYLGTLGRRAEASVPVSTLMISKSKFTADFAEALHYRFNIKRDQVGESLMEELANEFVEWLKSLGGSYTKHPTVEEILLVNDDSVALKFYIA